MAFRDMFCNESFTMKEDSDKLIMNTPTPSIMEHYDSFVECPSLWPSLSYNECLSDTDKEIWISMFDEETTMDVFPTHCATPHSTLLMEHNYSDHDKTINFTTASLGLTVQAAKRKHSDDCTESPPRKRSTKIPSTNNNKPLVQKAVHNFSFKNFSWQAAIQSDNCQPIQQSVIRRLNV